MNTMPASIGGATAPAAIQLPRPALGQDLSLADALKRRRTVREVSTRRLSRKLLSNLLWAACGVNRRKGPFGVVGRTAASASNSQEVEVFVALEDGAYRYDPFEHRLLPVAGGDLRPLAISHGQRQLGDRAPVRLIYVANVARLEHSAGFDESGLHDPDVQKSYYFVDTGLIAGNVYLFAAANGLAAWFHHCDHEQLPALLHLQPQQHVLFAQTVGYPAAPLH